MSISGSWPFSSLSTGTYTVRVVAQPGVATTTPTNALFAIKLGIGQNVKSLLIGEEGVA